MDRDVPANLKREWKSNVTSPCRTAGDFVVLTYNILNTVYCPEGLYQYCPDDMLATERRHPLLMKEVDHHKDADIICMQEVNQKYYDDVLLPDMQVRGFKGDYAMMLVDETTTVETEHVDGSATFYRGTRFQLMKEAGGQMKQLLEREKETLQFPAELSLAQVDLIDSAREYLFSLFRCLKTNRLVAVGNVHLTFRFYKQMDLTALEAAVAVNNLVRFAGGVDVAHILCGDFNQEPHHPGYQLLHDGKLNETMATYLRNFKDNGNERVPSLVDVFPGSFKHDSASLKSAYESVVGHEIPFSNYEDISAYAQLPRKDELGQVVKALFNGTPSHPQVRKTDPEAVGSEKFIAALDYIWFSSNSLHCDGVLEMVDEELILPFHACPNAVFPSDHLPVKARFSFLEAFRNPTLKSAL